MLQLFRNSGYASYLTTTLQPLLDNKPVGSYKVSRALARLYSGKERGLISTADIRKYVAEESGKIYLNIQTQEDAEEFMCALEATMSKEHEISDQFKSEQENNWGK